MSLGIRFFDGLRPWGLRGALGDAAAGMTLASMNIPPGRRLHADSHRRLLLRHHHRPERGHLVPMTGDDVNDAPALKQADCGTTVSGATDAARSAAALIVTAPGLWVINDAIDEARRIFGRITRYTVYRVALTMDIMFLVVLSTILLGFKPLTAIDRSGRRAAKHRRLVTQSLQTAAPGDVAPVRVEG